MEGGGSNDHSFSLTTHIQPNPGPLLISCTWFERVSILVILLNCITLGMYQPCVDDDCVTNRCKVLQVSIQMTLISVI